MEEVEEIGRTSIHLLSAQRCAQRPGDNCASGNFPMRALMILIPCKRLLCAPLVEVLATDSFIQAVRAISREPERNDLRQMAFVLSRH
jgi:hypothetical protein